MSSVVLRKFMQLLVLGCSISLLAQTSVPTPKATAGTDQTVATQPIASTSACDSCFATFGAGVVLSSTKFGDYTNPSNVLQSTHLGNGTPQFAVGIAYKLPFREFGSRIWSKNHCDPKYFFTPRTEGADAFCYPWKAFVSLKFSPDASQTFNGFTYGFSHALHKKLDFMLGLSFSAFNEISPGFQQAAVYTVKTQQAANNPYYAQYNLSSLQSNGAMAYDGFPTQLLKPDGTTGPLIYSGPPLILHYHSGLFVGVAIPLSFKSLVGGQ